MQSFLSLIFKSGLTLEHIAEFLVEFVHTAGGVNDFLLAGVERMAQRTNLDIEVFFFHSRTGSEFIAARASYVNFAVIGMSILFHLGFLLVGGHRGCAYASK